MTHGRRDDRRREGAAQRNPRRAARGAAAGPALSLTARKRLAVLVLVLATLVFFQALLFGGRTLVSPDALAPAGFAKVGTEELARGVYPLWNPYIFAGMPSFGSLLYNPNVYVPDIALAFVTRLLHLPTDTWLVLYYLLLGLGLFWFLLAEGVPPEAALVGGLALMFTPNLIAVGAYGHGSQLVTASLIPLALLFTAALFRRPRVWVVGALALAIGLQLLRAHVQIAYYSLLLIGLLALVETVQLLRARAGARRLGGALGGFAAALLLGAMMGAVLFLPIRDYAAHSIRSVTAQGGVTFDYATGWSMGIRELWTFVVPSALGFGGATYWGSMPFTDYPNYMGLGLLVLALAGLVYAPRRRAFFAIVGAFALLVALGKHFFLYRFLYEHLPYFNKFRVPVMILVLLQVALASLAGLVLWRADRERAGAGERRPSRGSGAHVRPVLGRLLVVAGIAIGALGLLFLVASGAFQDGYVGGATQALSTRGVPAANAPAVAREAWRLVVADVPRVALLAAAMLVASGLFALGRLGRAPWCAILVVVLLADLWVVDRKVMRPVVGRPSDRAAELARDDVVAFLEQDRSLYRVFPIDQQDFGDNRYAAFRVASIGGYHAAKPALYDRFLNATEFRELRYINMLNVKYLITRQAIAAPGLELVHDGSRKVYRNRVALPRAWFVERARAVPNGDSALAAVMRPDFDPAREAVVEGGGSLPALAAAGAAARVSRYDLNELEIETVTGGPALLVVSEAYYPDWKVYVDGASAPLLKADYLLRAVLVPAGRHRVRMAFESTAIQRGLRLSVAGGAAALLLLVLPPLAGRIRRRPRA